LCINIHDFILNSLCLSLAEAELWQTLPCRYFLITVIYIVPEALWKRVPN